MPLSAATASSAATCRPTPRSPAQHARAHAAATGHRVIRSFEPGEDWFWDYSTDQAGNGPRLAPADSHPADQPAPGPAGAVPADWRSHLNR